MNSIDTDDFIKINDQFTNNTENLQLLGNNQDEQIKLLHLINTDKTNENKTLLYLNQVHQQQYVELLKITNNLDESNTINLKQINDLKNTIDEINKKNKDLNILIFQQECKISDLNKKLKEKNFIIVIINFIINWLSCMIIVFTSTKHINFNELNYNTTF